MNRMIHIIAAGLAFSAAFVAKSEDRTISADYTLTADETVSGTLTVNAGVTVNLAGHKLTVGALAGTGKITSTYLDSTVEAPSAITDKCCYWFDAADASTITTNTSGLVTKWMSKDKTSRYASASSSACPTYDTTTYDRPTVDFGGLASGKYMTLSQHVIGLRTVFWVVKIEKSMEAFLLGDSSKYQFHRGAGGLYGNPSHAKFSQVWNDEREVDWVNEYIPDDEPQVITATMTENSYAQYLARDRNLTARYGGQQLFEFISFSNGSTPTDDERLAITRYLMAKWKGTNIVAEVHFSTADGVSATNSGVAIGGNIKVVKDGAGSFTTSASNQSYSGGTEILEGSYAVDNAGGAVANGTISVASGAELSLLASGVTYDTDIVLDSGTLRVVADNDATSLTTTIDGTVSLEDGSSILFDITSGSFTGTALTLATGGFLLGDGVESVESCASMSGSGYAMTVDETGGSIALAKSVAPVTAEWTGGGDASSFSDPDNWVCRNVIGEVLEGVVPTEDTKTITLSADADWSAFGAVDLASDAVLDLCGHELRISAMPDVGEITSSAFFLNADQEVPSIVSSEAILWLDAADSSTLGLESDGVTVNTWSTKGTVSTLPYANGTEKPTYDTATHCRPAVDLGKLASGKTFFFGTFTNLRTVFMVAKIEKSRNAFLLGSNGNNFHFHRGTYGEYGSDTSSKFNKVWNGLDEVDWANDTMPCDDFQVMTAEMTQDCTANFLANDRGIDKRNGGKAVCELICFSRALTDAERTAVIEYLQGKWFAETTQTGTLRISVAEGETVENTSIPITGNLKLVKDGLGTFVATKSGQKYFCGTLIKEGVLKPASKSDLRSEYLGYRISTVTVSTNGANKGVLDLNGAYAQFAMQFVMDGGIIKSSVQDRPDTNGQFLSMKLTADSKIVVSNNCGFYGNSQVGTTIDLNGHTLSVEVADDKHFMLEYARILNGTFDISGGQLVFGNTSAAYYFFATNATVRLNSGVYSRVSSYSLNMGDLVALYTGSDNTGTKAMNVYGTFTPASTNFFGCVMQDGSTLDFSEWPAAWPVESHFTTGATNLTFASGATIGVKIGSKGVGTESKLLSWSSQPDATFVRADTDRVYTIYKKDDGLYCRAGLIFIVR